MPYRLNLQRVKHINHLMNNIHNLSTEIYEGLIDGDFNNADSSIDELILTLNNIKTTIKDEV